MKKLPETKSQKPKSSITLNLGEFSRKVLSVLQKGPTKFAETTTKITSTSTTAKKSSQQLLMTIEPMKAQDNCKVQNAKRTSTDMCVASRSTRIKTTFTSRITTILCHKGIILLSPRFSPPQNTTSIQRICLTLINTR